jgi:hypothetical protein
MITKRNKGLKHHTCWFTYTSTNPNSSIYTLVMSFSHTEPGLVREWLKMFILRFHAGKQ